MASGGSETVSLRRKENCHPWGFRMQGGREHNMPLFVAKVGAKTIAGKAGLGVGDVILQICGSPCNGWSHQEAKNEMMRAGNEVDLTVQRGMINMADPAIQAMSGQQAKDTRSELVEESINPCMNEGTKFRNVTPKTYKILEAQLNSSDPPPSAMAAQQPARQMQPVHAQQAATPRPAAAAGKPSSIFDRKKQDRSDYLVAQGNTIQKTFGQQ